MEDEGKKKVFKVATSTWQDIIKESRKKKKEGSVTIETKQEEEKPAASGFFLDFGDSSAPPMPELKTDSVKSSKNKPESNTSRPRKSDE